MAALGGIVLSEVQNAMAVLEGEEASDVGSVC